MQVLQLNYNIFLYFYNSFLGETPLKYHQKTIAVPRYSYDPGFQGRTLFFFSSFDQVKVKLLN